MKARQTFQRGFVSDPIRTRYGTVFVIRYRIRNDAGTWKHRSETLHGFAGKKQARDVLNQRIRECATQTLAIRELTLSSFVDTYWRPYLDRKQIKPSTRRSYDSGLRLHILPKLGAVQLLDISPLHVEELVRSKLESGMSPKTVRNLLALLQSLFALAVDNDMITRSPVRSKHKPAVDRHEKPIWTPLQVKQILDKVAPEHRSCLECIALTGARLGEILGLQWKYVDLNVRKLEIRYSLWNGQLVSPKTESSIRTFYFGWALANALSQQRERSAHVGPDDFVFCKPDGASLHPDVLRRDVLYPALDRLGIPRSSRSAGFHTFRHSAGSIINAQTGNMKLAQKLLGHSNFSTTADIYTHTSAEAERDAALALERAIYGDLFQTVPRTWNRNSTTGVN